MALTTKQEIINALRKNQDKLNEFGVNEIPALHTKVKKILEFESI